MSALFEEWKTLLSATSDHFVEDGVISEEHWARAEKRILFILKETNDYRGNIANLIRVAATSRPQSKLWDRPTFHNLGRWAYGLLNASDGEASYKEAHTARKRALLPCAFINVKKTSGGRAATNAVELNAQMYSVLLRKQIEILAPNIIVFGGTYKMIKDHVLPELTKVGPRIHKYGEVVCINANHPACTKKRTEMFDQVVGSYRRFVDGIRK
jgi:hypothetical protein